MLSEEARQLDPTARRVVYSGLAATMGLGLAVAFVLASLGTSIALTLLGLALTTYVSGWLFMLAVRLWLRRRRGP